MGDSKDAQPAWGLGCSQPGGQVGGERGQVRVGPRSQRLAHPRIQLIPAQPALHERGLQHADYLLAVGMTGPQVTAAHGCRPMVSRLWHHWLLRRRTQVWKE
jgi:hypothetical protein